MGEKGSQSESGRPSLIPWPSAIDEGLGRLELQSAAMVAVFEAASPPLVEQAVERLAADVARLTGLVSGDPVPVRIRTGSTQALLPGIEEDESYWLVIDDAGIYLDAGSQWGALRGLSTLSQLVQADGCIPHVAIDDR
ncbi:MAG: hypothetical protein EP301_11945, partial [Gammaproteobacteria bacterium]